MPVSNRILWAICMLCVCCLCYDAGLLRAEMATDRALELIERMEMNMRKEMTLYRAVQRRCPDPE